MIKEGLNCEEMDSNLQHKKRHMKTIKIRLNVSTIYVGSNYEEEIEFEVEDDATEEEIQAEKEEIVKDWLFENVNWGWIDVD